MEPLVSILIPVYNAEEFIAKALDSCINQTYRNIEIIIVDDCSRDTTREILRKYSDTDERIHVMYKTKNEGVTIARNNLLSISSGQYLMFCDADDYMEPDAVNKAVTILEKQKTDCVIFRYRLIKNGFTKKLRTTYIADGKYNKLDYMKHHLCNPKTLYWGVLWNKCYRADLIRKNNIEFQKGIEDVIFNINYLGYAQSINVISDCLYNYNQTNVSLTRQKKNLTQENENIIYDKLLDKWYAYGSVYQAFISNYGTESVSYRDKINLKSYLFSIYLDIKEEANKNNLNSLVDKISKEGIFLGCVEGMGVWKYIIILKSFMQRRGGVFKRSIVKFIEIIMKKK